jgi:hypothetical protein
MGTLSAGLLVSKHSGGFQPWAADPDESQGLENKGLTFGVGIALTGAEYDS